MNIFNIRTAFMLLPIGALLLTGCDSEKEKDNSGKEIKNITIERIESGNLSRPVHTSGILRFKKESVLSFKTGGVIDRIYVDAGDNVSKGQLLARLDLAEIKAQYNKALSAFNKAERDLERIERLYQDSIATLELKQNLETALSVAKADLNVAEFNLKHSKIHAPSKGKILKKFMSEDEITGAGTPVLYFGSSSSNWIIRTGLSDRDVIKLTHGDSADVEFDAYPGKIFKAEVNTIGEAADPKSGTFEVELRLKDCNEKLAAGFVAVLDIHYGTEESYAVIPADALLEADGENGEVFVFDKATSRVKKRNIIIYFIYRDKVSVKRGLEDAAYVVTGGRAYVDHNDSVKVSNRGEL